MTDFYSLFDKGRGEERPTLTVVGGTRPTGDLHPYAAAAVTAELARLDHLPRPWSPNSYWDTTTFEVACNLLEIANSPWSGYSTTDAEHDLYAHAPTDARWGRREHEAKWTSAQQRVGAQGRPEPAPGEAYVVPEVTVVDENVGEDDDPLARFNLIDWGHLKRSDDAPEEWLAEPLIAKGRMTALYSAPKAGKSLLVLEVVAAIALGLPTLGQPPQEPATVLYVDFENDPRGDIKPRLEDMGHDLDDLQGRLFVATFPSMARLDTPQGGYDLLWLAQQLEASLVVIDTVSRTVGGEENDNNTWLSFYRNTGILLKREGIACLRLDHSGKDVEKGMRGGSAKYGDVDAVWRLTAASETVLELVCTDHRMPLDTLAFTVVRRTDPLRHEVAGDPFAVTIDAKERDLMATLERLEVPTDWGRDRVRKALADAGIKAENTLISRVIKARKVTILDLSRTGERTGADSQPSSRLSGTPHRGPDGGQVGPVRNGQGQVDQDDQMPPLFQVACKSCYSPTHRDYAHEHSGLCPKCSSEAGLVAGPSIEGNRDV